MSRFKSHQGVTLPCCCLLHWERVHPVLNLRMTREARFLRQYSCLTASTSVHSRSVKKCVYTWLTGCNSCDSWIMSAQFHARETKTSEKMDYLGAVSIVYSTLFLSLSRSCLRLRSQVTIFLFSILLFSFNRELYNNRRYLIRLAWRYLHAFTVTCIQCEIESIMVWTWSCACA